jgi:hypothetical protein
LPGIFLLYEKGVRGYPLDAFFISLKVAGCSRTPTGYFAANFVSFVDTHPQRMLDTLPVTPLLAASLSIKNHSGPK